MGELSGLRAAVGDVRYARLPETRRLSGLPQPRDELPRMKAAYPDQRLGCGAPAPWTARLTSGARPRTHEGCGLHV